MENMNISAVDTAMETTASVTAGLKNKLCNRIIHQKMTILKLQPKESNAEERLDAGCEIKRWKTAANELLFFISSIGYLRADKPQGFGDRVPSSRQAAKRSSK